MSVLLPMCDDVLTQVGNTVECSGNWVLVEVPDYVEFAALESSGSTFDIADLDSPTMASAWGAGFILMGLAFAAGIGARTLLRFISRG